MGDRIGIAVIGAGEMGWMHALHAAYEIACAKLVGVCDVDEAIRARVMTEFKVPTYERIEDLLAAPDVDAVVISTPAVTHAAVISSAALAHKHIFCEKPVGLTLEDADAALRQVAASGLHFQIGFQRRWDPAFSEARMRIQSGDIGKPVLFRSLGRDPIPSGVEWPDPMTTGGIFLDAAIHDYDAARFLMGREIRQICAFGGNLIHSRAHMHGDLDTCHTFLTFEDETCGVLEWTRFSPYGYDAYTEVVGTEGALRIGGTRKLPLVTLSQRGKVEDIMLSFISRFDEAYRAELLAFAQSILEQTAPTPNVDDARMALHLALLARESFEKGQPLEVADLPPGV